MIPRPSLRRPRRHVRPGWLGPLGTRLRSVPPVLGVVAGILVVAVVAAAVVFWPRPEPVRVTADFVRAVGLFPGSDVRILGVRVGTVTSVEPQGEKVRVAFEFTPEHPVPADAQAAVVAPSLVSDRYVQLLPAYTAGPRMRSGAHIPLERTAVPVELDRVSQSLDDLMVALGPTGANSQGALTRVLQTGAANLGGNGQALHDTTQNLSLAVQTFSQGRGDLFGTVKNLNTFTETLATNDAKVRRLNTNLTSVSTALDDERGDLSAALANLAVALDEIAGFVKDNRAVLKDDVARLADVTGAVAEKRRALGETLDNAPVAISNLQLAYNAANGTLDTRATVQGADNPGLLLCSLVTGPTNTGNTKLCDTLGLLDLKAPTGSSSGPLLQGADPTLGGLLG